MKTSNKRNSNFGEQLRNLREVNNYTLKHVSEHIGIDTSLLAKIERNERQPTKTIIKNVAHFFNVNEKTLHDNFLSDQIAYKIFNEEADLSILKDAEAKVLYLKLVQNEK